MIVQTSVQPELKKLADTARKQLAAAEPVSIQEAIRANLVTDEVEASICQGLITIPALLNHPDLMALDPADFGVLKYRYTFEAIRRIWQRDQPIAIDWPILKVELGEHFEQAGGVLFQVELGGYGLNSLETPIYARLLLKVATHRRRVEAAAAVLEANLNNDYNSGKVTEAAKNLLTVLEDRQANVLKPISWTDRIARARARHQGWTDAPSSVRGWPTGIKQLDAAISGVGNGVLSIYGATSMGKSTLARQFSLSIAREGGAVNIASTEMHPDRFIDNLAGEMAGLSFKKLQSGFLNAEEKARLGRAHDELEKLRIVPIDSPAPTPRAIEAFCRARKREGQCDALVIDSGSNLYTPEGKGEIFNETRIAAGAVLQIAYELQIPVIVTWHIGRNAKQHASNPSPRIDDAKGGSDIEYNSDIVLGLFWPHYYTARGIKLPAQFATCSDRDAYLFVLKDRNGGIGNGLIPLIFEPGKGYVDAEVKVLNL